MTEEGVIADADYVDNAGGAHHAEERCLVHDVEQSGAHLVDPDQNVRVYRRYPQSHQQAKNHSVMPDVIPSYFGLTAKLEKAQYNNPQRNSAEKQKRNQKPQPK